MKRVYILVITVCALALLALVVLATSESGFRLTVLGGTGDRVSNGGLALEGTLGQSVAGGVVTGTLGLCSGLWCGGSRGNEVYMPLALRGFAGGLDLVDAPDLCESAQAVAISWVYQDDFDYLNDNDWYAFQAAAGQTYTIWTFGLEANADTLLYLHGACGTAPLAYNDDYGLGKGSRIVWVAPVSGIYHVDVLQYDYAVYGIGTGYTFQVLLGEGESLALDAALGDKPTLPSVPVSIGRQGE